MNILKQYQALLDKSQKGSLLPVGGKQRNLWVPGEGENLIRLMPWEREPDTLPENIRRAFTVISDTGEESLLMSFFLPVKVHSLNNELFSCGITYGERCPVCAKGSEYWGMFEEGNRIDVSLKELAKRHFSQNKFVSIVIPIKDEKGPFVGIVPKPYLYGKSVFEGILGLVLKANRNKEFIYGDVSNRETGRVVGFTRTGKGKTDTRYKDFFAMDDILPLPDGLKSLDPLDEFKKEYPFDEEKLLTALKGSLLNPTIPSILDVKDIVDTLKPIEDPSQRVKNLEDIRKLVDSLGVKVGISNSDEEVDTEEVIDLES